MAAIDLTDFFRIGHGYDLHRLEPIAPAGRGRPLRLGGMSFDHPMGPVGHSDGDAVLHAVTDAILGGLGAPDLGTLFPDTDPAHEGADSRLFLDEAAQRMRDAGYDIGNMDITIVCEQPKIGPHRDALRNSLAAALGCEAHRINTKGKTHEGLDSIGEGRAIEVHAVALLVRVQPPS